MENAKEYKRIRQRDICSNRYERRANCHLRPTAKEAGKRAVPVLPESKADA